MIHSIAERSRTENRRVFKLTAARIAASVVTIAIGVVSGSAEAQPSDAPPEAPTPFGAGGQVVLSVDRLVGASVGILRSKSKGPNPDTDFGNCSGTRATAWFFGSSDVSASTCASNPGGGIRWGADVFLARGISLGGTMSVTSESVDQDTRSSTSGVDSLQAKVSSRLITLSPRIGYVHALGSNWAIWPRAGIDWTNTTVDMNRQSELTGGNQMTFTSQLVNATLEAKFVFAPISHVALFGGPYARLPIWNGTTQAMNALELEYRSNSYEVGATGGALLYF